MKLFEVNVNVNSERSEIYDIHYAAAEILLVFFLLKFVFFVVLGFRAVLEGDEIDQREGGTYG